MPPRFACAMLCAWFAVPQAWSEPVSEVRGGGYPQTKRETEALRKRLRDQWRRKPSPLEQEMFLDTVSAKLTEALLEKIVPPWHGTPWTFEGHTETPRVGSVACGYFVSTTLRDVGIRLDRFRLAQRSPEAEARSIAIRPDRVRLHRDSLRSGLPLLASRLEDGVYFVGLTNHVGYLRKSGSSIRFIHSDYVGGSVADQSANRAPAFAGETLWVVDLSGNRDLARAWLEGTKLRIHR